MTRFKIVNERKFYRAAKLAAVLTAVFIIAAGTLTVYQRGLRNGEGHLRQTPGAKEAQTLEGNNQTAGTIRQGGGISEKRIDGTSAGTKGPGETNATIQNSMGSGKSTKQNVQGTTHEQRKEPSQRKESKQKSTSRSFNRNNLQPYGTFKITNYTAGFESCGKLPSDPAYGITATGKKVKEHHTIATDWAVLAPGTKVMIEGLPYIYTVEDKGGAVDGKHIDVYTPELKDALDWGVQYREVYIIEGGNI